MISNMTEQNTQQSFFEKHKKWIVALVGVQLIPTILILSVMIGGITYFYVNNDTNFHAYKSYIIAGFKSGFKDGQSNYVRGKKAPSTLWHSYEYHTDKLKEKAFLEKEEYLSQFPESERGSKLAEMKLHNIKLPLQLELDKRFKSGLDFYADHVKLRINRGNFLSDETYNNALEEEAWKVGYAHGYNEGLDGSWYEQARRSID